MLVHRQRPLHDADRLDGADTFRPAGELGKEHQAKQWQWKEWAARLNQLESDLVGLSGLVHPRGDAPGWACSEFELGPGSSSRLGDEKRVTDSRRDGRGAPHGEGPSSFSLVSASWAVASKA